MIPQRLSVVTLGARDLPRLRAFYAGWGWNQVPESSDEWAAFLAGGVVLALYPLAALAEEAAPSVTAEPDSDWRGFTLALNVDAAGDVDRVFRSAVEAGAASVSEPQDRAWGGRSAYVSDPEGNRWEIAWAPGARFDERGAVVSFGSET